MGNKIGLIGFNTLSGLGTCNRQLMEHCQISVWLIVPHQRFSMHHIHPTTCELRLLRNQKSDIVNFVRSVDVIIFCETPLSHFLIPECIKQKKRVVCIPMQERLPPFNQAWLRGVDLFICPTQQCYNIIKNTLPSIFFPWPIDCNALPFLQRNICTSFLFINGNGGWCGRKGIQTIYDICKLWPDIPLLVRSQRKINLIDKIPILSHVQEIHQLYEQGSVLIAPHYVDGIGLEILEAMACGMPVITTHGEPWSEFPALHRISASKTKVKINNRMVDWYIPSTYDLVDACKKLLNTNISQDSIKAREWAHQRSWSENAMQFRKLILG